MTDYMTTVRMGIPWKSAVTTTPADILYSRPPSAYKHRHTGDAKARGAHLTKWREEARAAGEVPIVSWRYA